MFYHNQIIDNQLSWEGIKKKIMINSVMKRIIDCRDYRNIKISPNSTG